MGTLVSALILNVMQKSMEEGAKSRLQLENLPQQDDDRSIKVAPSAFLCPHWATGQALPAGILVFVLRVSKATSVKIGDVLLANT